MYPVLLKDDRYLHPFTIATCFACGHLYKIECPGFFGGKGIAGQVIGWYPEIPQFGYCSHECDMLHTD